MNVEIGFEDTVLEEVKKMKNVTEVYMVYGVYDLIIKVEADTMNELKDVVFSSIRKLDKVRSTITLTVM